MDVVILVLLQAGLQNCYTPYNNQALIQQYYNLAQHKKWLMSYTKEELNVLKIWVQSISWQHPLRGDSSIFKMAFDWLFQFRLGYCPTGLENWPCRVRAPSRGQKQEKNYCGNTKKRPLSGIATKGLYPKKFMQMLSLKTQTMGCAHSIYGQCIRTSKGQDGDRKIA